MSGISVEALPDAGAPQAGITVDGLGTGSPSVISVDVSWDGGATWHGVRGAHRLEVVGGAFVRDHVPPLNVNATYRLTVHSGTVVPDVVEASWRLDSPVGWLQDPLAPRSAVAIRTDVMAGGAQTLMYGALASATWSQATDYAVPMGARYPVASVGQRMMAGAVPLTVSHDVAAEGGALRRLLLSAGQLVVRGLPADLLDPVAHITVGDVTERRIGDRLQVSTWDLVATQVRPQSLRIVVPWWTHAQVREMWAGMTYAQVKAARPGDTYLDWQRSPEVP